MSVSESVYVFSSVDACVCVCFVCGCAWVCVYESECLCVVFLGGSLRF